MNKKVGIFLFSGVAVIVFSIVLVMTIVPKVLNNQLKKSLALENGSNTFEIWKKLPIAINVNIYLFNVTNPAEVSAGAKPILKEVGPYVYDEYLEKTILDPGKNNDSVTYMKKKTFFFNQTKSGLLTEKDKVTILNFAYLAIITKANEEMKGLVPIVDSVMPDMFKGLKDPFLRATVGEILFKGVFLNCSSSLVELVCEGMKVKLPPGITFIDTPTKKGIYLSLLGATNGTNEGPIVANKGNKDLYKLGVVKSFEGKTNVSIFKKPCSEIKGTDGTIVTPMDRNNVSSKLYFYEPSMCRSVFAELTEQNETMGIKSYRYESTFNTFGGKNVNPENNCYCLRNWSSTLDTCAINGVYDISACKHIPIIASNPHFYLGSEELLKYADGVKPIKEKHETFVEIERITSGTLKGRRRLQFNMQLEPLKDVPILKKVRSGLFPILWLEEVADIPPNLAEQLKAATYMVYVLEIIQWLPLLIGVFLLIVCVFFYFKSSRGHLAMKTNSIYTMNASRDNGVKNHAFSDVSLAVTKNDSVGMK